AGTELDRNRVVGDADGLAAVFDQLAGHSHGRVAIGDGGGGRGEAGDDHRGGGRRRLPAECDPDAQRRPEQQPRGRSERQPAPRKACRRVPAPNRPTRRTHTPLLTRNLHVAPARNLSPFSADKSVLIENFPSAGQGTTAMRQQRPRLRNRVRSSDPNRAIEVARMPPGERTEVARMPPGERTEVARMPPGERTEVARD